MIRIKLVSLILMLFLCQNAYSETESHISEPEKLKGLSGVYVSYIGDAKYGKEKIERLLQKANINIFDESNIDFDGIPQNPILSYQEYLGGDGNAYYYVEIREPAILDRSKNIRVQGITWFYKIVSDRRYSNDDFLEDGITVFIDSYREANSNDNIQSDKENE